MQIKCFFHTRFLWEKSSILVECDKIFLKIKYFRNVFEKILKNILREQKKLLVSSILIILACNIKVY